MNGKVKRLSKIGGVVLFLGMLMTVLAGCASKTMAVKETKKDANPSFEPRLITDISTSENLKSSIIWIRGNRLLTYTSVKQLSPPGVLIYFPETALGNINTVYVPASDIVVSIKASEITTRGHTSRIEILLNKDVSYEVTREDTDLKISFRKESKPLVSTDTKLQKEEQAPDKSKSAKERPGVSEQEKLVVKTTANETVKPQIKKDKPAWINRIDFSGEEDGKSTIIIGTTTPVKYDLRKINDKNLLLYLYNTRLPEYRQRPLITTRFQSAVDRITPVQTPAMKDTSTITIELRESTPYFLEQTDDLLLLHFEASSIPPRPLDKAKLPLWKKIMTQTAVDTGAKQEKAGDEMVHFETPQIKTPPHGAESTRSVSEEAALGGAYDIERQKTTDTMTGIKKSLDFYRTETKKKYVGEKIAVDFFKTNIKNVFRIIREISGENFAIDKDVTGEVTMTLEKPVPWDQVLALVLKMNKLGLVYEEDIIRVATLKTLAQEEEERKEKLAAKREAENQEELITVFMRISYVDAMEIGKHLVDDVNEFFQEQGNGNSKFNPDRGKVTVDKTSNMIVMSDVARSIKRAKEIVQKLDRVTPQVLIEARIVEASSNFSREIGVSLSGTLGPFGNRYNRDFSFTSTNLPLSTFGSLGINFSKLTGTPWTLDATIAAAESEGKVKIITSPKILTLDNKEALIKQGLEYPYNTRDEDFNTITEWKDITLELHVTPHVTPDNRISMEINIIDNEIGSVINGEQSFTTKEADTELLVNDGDTVVIGGIRKTREDRGESGVPGLMQIPVLGWLFKSKSNSDAMEELLIFITPRIVQLEQHGIKDNL